MLNLIRRLLPRSRAFRLALDSAIERFFRGWSWLPETVRAEADLVADDIRPERTRRLEEFEAQFGLWGSGTEEDRRKANAAAWKATGGQSPRYLQDVLQEAGFDVYVHEWWEPPDVAPRTPRDPRDYVGPVLEGRVQAKADSDPAQVCARADNTPGQPQANAWLAGDPLYFANLLGNPTKPPPIPDDPSTWPYFVYVGGETFPEHAEVPAARREEFRELLLRLFPEDLWIVTLVNYVGDVPSGFAVTDEDGFAVVDEDNFIVVTQ